MSTVITVKNIGKKYTISHQQREEYSSLRDVINNGALSLGRKLIRPFRSSLDTLPLAPASEDFWALKAVSFEVKQGDRIGIIGKNGAGKSTLLKILSRITEPTTGSIRIKGRVASLLEVGTGFHPELTGRENIFLNGAILGMQREEIRSKFDEIVDFAEIERFLDTPVKHYSSGMYVRLAFAVAAHLEPEILIVDEVLAVGDSQFQKKCLGKMEDVGREGRTVLFVSHNMGAVKRLCDSCLLLNEGKIESAGVSEYVIRSYMSDCINGSNSLISWNDQDSPGDSSLKLRSARLVNIKNEQTAEFRIDEPIIIEIEIYLLEEHLDAHLSIFIKSTDGIVVLHTSDIMEDDVSLITTGTYKLKCEIPAYCFNAGKYYLDLASDVPFKKVIFHEKNALSWEVLGTCEKMGRYGMDSWRGILGPGIAKWSNERCCQ